MELVNSINFLDKINADKGLVLVQFWSHECKICDKASKILSNLKEIYTEKIIIYRVDAKDNENIDLINKYEIKAIPTFLFFLNGNEEGRVRGFNHSFEIERLIRSLM